MIRLLKLVAGVLAATCVVCVAYAQTGEPAPVDAQQAAPPAQSAEIPGEPSPPPGEEVMKPTTHGIRLTPRLARAVAAKWIEEIDQEGGGFTKDQQERMTETMTRRIMQTAHTHAKEGAPFLEYLYESMIGGQGQVPAENAKEFADRTKKGAIPFMRDLGKDLVDDFRPILNDEEQLKSIKKIQDELDKVTNGLESRMDRWAENGIKEKKNPFAGLDDPQSGEVDQTKNPKSQPMQRAVWDATRNIMEQGPHGWKEFLNQVRVFMEYDDEQYAKGLELLRQYRRKAAAIMTTEWNDRVRRNRIKVHFGKMMKAKPLEPWFYYMGNEYDELLNPVLDLGREFRRDVMALATEKQRQTALARLQEFAGNHGLSPSEVSAETLHLAAVPIEQEETAASQPAQSESIDKTVAGTANAKSDSKGGSETPGRNKTEEGQEQK